MSTRCIYGTVSIIHDSAATRRRDMPQGLEYEHAYEGEYDNMSTTGRVRILLYRCLCYCYMAVLMIGRGIVHDL